MMKKCFYSVVVFGMFCSVIALYLWIDYVRLAEVQHFVGHHSEEDRRGRKISIAIIGDSWVAGNKIDHHLLQSLSDLGMDASVVSSGHPGAKSRLIYRNMFKPEDERFSSRFVFENPIDICIVIAGVNDAATYVGADFYSHHLGLIIQALVEQNITPLIVELPEFGLEEIDSNNILGKIRRRAMRLVHDAGEVDIIPKYRRASAEIVQQFGDDVLFFDFDTVASDYRNNRGLYKKDLVHLSEVGNQKFARLLAESIRRAIEDNSRWH